MDTNEDGDLCGEADAPLKDLVKTGSSGEADRAKVQEADSVTDSGSIARECVGGVDSGSIARECVGGVDSGSGARECVGGVDSGSGAKDCATAQNGSVRSCVNEASSPSGLGYLTVRDRCLTLRTLNSGTVEANGAVDVKSSLNGCESEERDTPADPEARSDDVKSSLNGRESEERDTPADPEARSDDAEGESKEAAGAEPKGDGSGMLTDDNTGKSISSAAGETDDNTGKSGSSAAGEADDNTGKSVSSTAGEAETDGVHADESSDSPAANAVDAVKEPNSASESEAPQTESSDHEADPDPDPAIVNDSGDAQSSSLADSEKTDLPGGVTTSVENVTESDQISSPAREKDDGSKESHVDVVCKQSCDSGSKPDQSSPSPLLDCSIGKDDADKCADQENTTAEAVNSESAAKPAIAVTELGTVSKSDEVDVDQASNSGLCAGNDTASTSPSRTDSNATESKKGDTDPVKIHPAVENLNLSSLTGISQASGVTTTGSVVKSQFSPSKSTARKSVPGGDMRARPVKATARKTGQPQAVVKALCTPGSQRSGEGTIKIVNFHPNSNITLKLSELEKVLKVTESAKANHPRGHENVLKWDGSPAVECVKRVSESPLFAESSPGWESAASDASPAQNSSDASVGVHFGLKAQHRRRRKKGGTYDFPGVKKLPKRKKVSAAAANSESRDKDDVSDLEPLRKVIKKPMGSPCRQSTVVELFKNRQFHKRQTTHNALMRRKSPDSPLGKKKTVLQMLKERRRSGGQPSDFGSGQKALSHSPLLVEKPTSGTQLVLVSDPTTPDGRTVSHLLGEKQISGGAKTANRPEGEKMQMVQKLFITKDGWVSSVNIEDASERENMTQRKVVKRKLSIGNSLGQSGSSEGPAAKKRKTGDGEDSHPPLLQPMVMVVAQHSQNAPGLRSILPKPHMASAAVAVSAASLTASSGSTPVMVSAGQKLLLSGTPLLMKPGTKVAFVPASGKSSFSLLPTSGVSSAKGVPVPTSSLSSFGRVVNVRTTMSQPANRNSDALRALLASPNGPRPRQVSILTGSIPVAQVLSVPSSAATSISFAQAKVLTSSSTSSSSASSSMSGSRHLGGDGKSVTSLPNGLLFPVTPPKTPEGEAVAEGIATAPSHDSDAIPLCCCKIVGAFFNKLSSGATYCQALDSVDGKILGCCNKVSNLQLVRPGVKIPFMAVCEVHRKRLKLHQCCPGCGHFCTQGKFYQCRKEGSSVHNFHKQCQTERDGRLFCPHCGEESGQVEVTLALNEPQLSQSSEQIRANLRKSISKARMTPCSLVRKKADVPPGVSLTLPNSKTISSDGLPVGPDRDGLEKLMHLCLNKAERPKKYRVLPKNMYGPAAEGDLEKVFYMLVDGMDPNQICEEEDNQTVLHGAVYSGNVTLVYLLMQAGACLHTQDKTLKTALMCAAEYGYLEIVKLLSKAGARLDDRGEDHMTCLHYAAKSGHVDIIQYILDINAVDVNATDEGGWTPIMWATESQLVPVVNFLVSRGGDPGKKDNEENTALHWAAFAGSLEITELFLDLGCELDSPNEHGDRPLHIAARQDHYEVVVILLARGANVDLKNNKDETPVTCCPNPNSQVCMALKVNKQLRSFSAKLMRPEKLVHRDVSVGRERNPIACVNAVDDEPHPSDYLYIDHNVETQDLHINNVITSLQSCRCKDDCSSVYCVCSRSSVKCWFDKFGRLLEDFNLLDPPLIFECNRACRCWVNCNNRVVQNGITVRMQVFRTNGRGWGVRSLMDIPKGTFICEYVGELISDSEADRREDDSYLFDLDNKDGDTYCLDARKYGNVARFINHLCEPNLVPVKVFVEHQDLRFPRICFFSSRDVKAYEELGFDYGEKFWIIKWKQFTCACGSPKCKYSTETIQRTLEEYRLRHEDEAVGQES